MSPPKRASKWWANWRSTSTRGFDKAGKAVNGIIDADTAKLARARLRKMGLFPTDVTEQAKGGRATRGSGLNVENRLLEVLPVRHRPATSR